MTKIIIDAMGGDYAPKQQVAGAVNALQNDKDLYLILVGDETQINAELADKKYDKDRLEIVHTTETIGMEEIPTKAVKTTAKQAKALKQTKKTPNKTEQNPPLTTKAEQRVKRQTTKPQAATVAATNPTAPRRKRALRARRGVDFPPLRSRKDPK